LLAGADRLSIGGDEKRRVDPTLALRNGKHNTADTVSYRTFIGAIEFEQFPSAGANRVDWGAVSLF
jgi:hypothetical protein